MENKTDNNCVFCKIIEGKLPSAKIFENDDFISILDINPNMKGATLVLSKKHYPSYGFEAPRDVINSMMEASKDTAKLLEKALEVKRVALIMEGTGINHLHFHLYPLNEQGAELDKVERSFFKEYPGYVSTQLGPQADMDELNDLAKFIVAQGF